MRFDIVDLKRIGWLSLVFLFVVEALVVVYPEKICFALLGFLFVMILIGTPFVIKNLEKFSFWFWVLSAIGWILLPIVIYIWLPERGHDASTIAWYEENEKELRTISRFTYVIVSSICGALISAVSIFMARRLFLKKRRGNH